MPFIQIFCFRGTAGFKRTEYMHLPGLIKIGHVGVKFEDDPIIYGFHPSPKAVKDAGGTEGLLALLNKRQYQEGIWQDDTAIFNQAYQLSQQGKRTEVRILSQNFPDDEYDEIRNTSIRWYNGEKIFRYNLPEIDGTFADGDYNCATFPKVLGIKLPVDDGRISAYFKAMIELGAKTWQK
jgi:hypothetical protein